MKITICDPCKKLDNKVTETMSYMKIKNNPHLRIDICDLHKEEVKGMSIPDYIRYCYKLNGITLTETDDEIKQKYLS